jgi:hypothetical protein
MLKKRIFLLSWLKPLIHCMFIAMRTNSFKLWIILFLMLEIFVMYPTFIEDLY